MTQTEHQAVLQALQEAILQIEHLHNIFQSTVTGEEAIASLKKAIKIMEAN